jgi:hypothetical protein
VATDATNFGSWRNKVMQAMRNETDHHASAAVHHILSMQAHVSASRHYQVGKDYAHAAHQALVAHGHALQALQRGQIASDNYAGHDGNPLMRMLGHAVAASSTSTAVTSPISLDLAQRHLRAAEHHQFAAVHHAAAGQFHDGGHYVRAAHETRRALDHGKHGLFHGNEAARHHVEHYGSHPSAELV